MTGYRLSSILLLMEEVALFDVVGEQGETGETICSRIGWDRAYGKRFLDCLCRLGLLDLEGASYLPSRFSRTFLCRRSAAFQGQTLAFEQHLHRSWQQLGATLRAGQRVFATENKSETELAEAFRLYLGAMDEAAALRAEELWQAIGPLPPRGCILDIGAGSGAFLAAFLRRHPTWSAMYCDLPQVVDSSNHPRLDPFASRLSWCRCNLLDAGDPEFAALPSSGYDLVLLSNLIHCQSAEENERILQRAVEKTAAEGKLLIHDFFSDCGWRGALYDLHMMLNTYNGRTYPVEECVDMAARCGFGYHISQALHSGSTLLTLARSESVLYGPTYT
nr:methyltransferase [uncultured Desulfobulbus sp.]